jgi:hypothetical protein
MKRSLPARIAVCMVICGLVGGILAVLGGGDDPRRATVVTTSSQRLVGEFRGPAATGIVLSLGDRFQVVPWDVVSRVSFGEASAPGSSPVAVADATRREHP